MGPFLERNKTTEARESVSKRAQLPSQWLCSYEELPQWLRTDPLIRRGYRKDVYSLKACLLSLWYIHNETVNVWSHLFPGLVFTALNILGKEAVIPKPTARNGFGMADIEWADWLAIRVFLLGANLCLIFSTTFHLLHPHSPKVSYNTLNLDYLGIILNILTTTISTTHFLPLSPSEAALHHSFCISTALATFSVILHPFYRRREVASLRACIFVAFGCSGTTSLLHAWLLYGYKGLSSGIPFKNIVLECSLYLAGALIYIARWPEGWPGVSQSDKFDIWGSSHQIFHIFTVLAQATHLAGLRSAVVAKYL